MIAFQKPTAWGNLTDMQNVKIFTRAGFFKPKLYPKAHMLLLNQIYERKNVNSARKSKNSLC